MRVGIDLLWVRPGLCGGTESFIRSIFVKKARLRRFETSRDCDHPTTFVRAELCKEFPF
ncbi:MAG: hypothetical protein J1E64_00185 [Acetatifactor sp.]|nr:hypothetical protein [Acetatifactor sp.]